jgi:hypothetical protein
MTAYKHWYGRLMHREPALFYHDGAFFVAALSPLIEREDFPDSSKRDAIFKRLAYDPHLIVNRPAQHFSDGGLWSNIMKETSDEKRANELAIGTAVHAAFRQPVGVLRLAMKTFLSYFDSTQLQGWLLSDQGAENMVDPTINDWLQRLYGVSVPRVYQSSPAKRWHLFAIPWYWFILGMLPVWPLLLIVYHRYDSPFFVLCALTSLMFLETATLLVDHPTPRFLTSAAWFTLLMLGIAGERVLQSYNPRFTP